MKKLALILTLLFAPLGALAQTPASPGNAAGGGTGAVGGPGATDAGTSGATGGTGGQIAPKAGNDQAAGASNDCEAAAEAANGSEPVAGDCRGNGGKAAPGSK
jgi:hypothetical protein